MGAASLSLLGVLGCDTRKSQAKPNIIVIFCDDLGYGDLGAFGHPTMSTPNLDRMAAQGQKWNSFYVAASVCTPSRAALITGRYPIRSGLCSDERRVLFPDSTGGIPETEITLAEALKKGGYATACIGKWHLGHLPPYLPTEHGFDYYFGIPYSNDMDYVGGENAFEKLRYRPKSHYWNVPLMRNEEVIERPADQNTITQRYTQEAVQFIKQNKNQPFFIYFPHSMVHTPLFASSEFDGVSRRGLFGDVMAEVDWSVGTILQTLEQENLAQNTLIVFSSDNGPWLSMLQAGGSAGLLRMGKGTTWEGGMREPTIFYWPGRIKPSTIMDMGSTLDLFPTVCALSGAEVPKDREMDGYDLSAVIFNGLASPRETMIYYRGEQVYAARKGPFKAHYITQGSYGMGGERTEHKIPLLFHLGHDPSEKYNIADQHPEVIQEINQVVEEHRKTVRPAEDQLEKRKKKA
ncbi:MAG: sulfatase-like hydrolase/transferase [Candidatus Aminicenantes bacterium]|nr:sulfatase-like hydrolase/transferase [Candidatus Aminicenantes bacterium]